MNKLKAIIRILLAKNYFVATTNKKDILYFYNTNLLFMYDVSKFADEQLDELIDMDNAANDAQQIIDNLN